MEVYCDLFQVVLNLSDPDETHIDNENVTSTAIHSEVMKQVYVILLDVPIPMLRKVLFKTTQCHSSA